MNFGMAYYGRGYKLQDAGCHAMDGNCRWSGPNDAGPCTNFPGVLAYHEIQDVIKQSKSQPVWNKTAGMKYVTWGDRNWIGYDDPDTWEQKAQFADEYCFGGQAFWSIDFMGNITDDFTDDSETPKPLELCTGHYDSFDAIERDRSRSKIPFHCINRYVVAALAKNLTDSVASYHKILDKGYDEKFGYYSKAMMDMWNADMDKFYHEKIDTYFTCIHQRNDGDGFHNETGVCPPETDGHVFSIYLVPKDENAMYRYIEETYGIDRSWISYQSWFFGPCILGPDPAKDCPDFGWIHGQPKMRPDFKVPNPKESISSSLQNITEMTKYLIDAAVGLEMGTSDAIDLHVAEGSSLPVLMVNSAVDSMQQVYDIGNEVQEKEREKIIMLFLTAILFIIPGIGEGLAAVTGIVAIARIATIIAEAGGTALAIKDMVENPKNAAFDIFGIILGGMALRSSKSFTQAAGVRRGMSAKDIGKLGVSVEKGMQQVTRLCNVCKITKV
ncbi:glycosyl hydrolases family 18-domain-containing protein [Cercophora newfieldiana]|uniref:Glycosyl hydrolases family 18-domain-containing protein n=1 Tax=Cercophora newfieldiana TaxID=92897 RepID=A0AA40CTB1_9PEZI|nr:glycosyl hydrolases family 18-domain-containing protein [Cercophora newfieldiana]